MQDIFDDMERALWEAKARGEAPTHWRMHPEALDALRASVRMAMLSFNVTAGLPASHPPLFGLRVYEDRYAKRGDWSLESGPDSFLREEELYDEMHKLDRQYQTSRRKLQSELDAIRLKRRKAA